VLCQTGVSLRYGVRWGKASSYDGAAGLSRLRDICMTTAPTPTIRLQTTTSSSQVMTAHGHRRQVLLFLIAIILPCAVLVVLGLRMVRQEQELGERCMADERRRMTSQLRQGSPK